MKKWIWLMILLMIFMTAPAARAGRVEVVSVSEFARMLGQTLGRAPEYSTTDHRAATRQEIAVMVVQALGRDAEGQKRDGASLLLHDLPDIDTDKVGYVEVAVGTGILETSWGWFYPSAPVSFTDMEEILWRALGVQARTLVTMKAGEWQPGEPLVFCGTPDARPLRAGIERIPARLPEESGPIRVYLHNHTNLCNRKGETLKLPAEGWRLQIFPYLSTHADVGLPILSLDLPAPPAELAPGEQVMLDVELGGGLAPGWYMAVVAQGAKEGRGAAFTGVLPIAQNQAFNWQHFLVTRRTLREYDGYSRVDGLGIVRAVWGENVEFQLPDGLTCTEGRATATGRNFSTRLPKLYENVFGRVPGETDFLSFKATCGEHEGLWIFPIPPISSGR